METILVVDDEADILKLISENLLVRGYQVTKAKNANDALGKLQAESPSLLVLDIKLPDLTGWQLLERLENDPTVTYRFPVLIMTASISDANMDMRKFPQVAEILVKPFSIPNFVAAVKRSINHKLIQE